MTTSSDGRRVSAEKIAPTVRDALVEVMGGHGFEQAAGLMRKALVELQEKRAAIADKDAEIARLTTELDAFERDNTMLRATGGRSARHRRRIRRIGHQDEDKALTAIRRELMATREVLTAANTRIAELEARLARPVTDECFKTLEAVQTWARQRCPCENEQPNPCPLCGADANKPGDVCLSAENTIPRSLLGRINLALSLPPKDGRASPAASREEVFEQCAMLIAAHAAEKQRADEAVARVKELEAALRPFAEWFGKLGEFADHNDDVVVGGFDGAFVAFGDLRKADRLLAETGGEHD